MGLYKYDNGVLIPIAGRGKAEYGASTTRNNTWTNTETIAPGGSVPFSVAFDVPMPDANYEVNWTCSASALHPVIDEKTASGFTGHAYRLVSPAVDSGNGVINFTAFRLYTDLEYNELLDDTEGLIKNTTESGVVNQFETTIHTQRYNKVIYTVNDDGTISLEIIQRPETNTGLSIGLIDVKAGETYKLTGGLSANERLELKNMDYSAWTNNTVNKAVSSPIVDTNVDTFMPNADATLRVFLRIDANGNTGNVGTIEPMIRFASFLDDTFIPYAKTNRLLTVETDELFANAAMLKGMTEITAQTDLDDVTSIGEYFKSSTSIYVTNAPTGIDSETSAVFRLKVENGSDSTTFVQTIVEDDGTTYKRGYDGTTWSTWAELASSSSVSGLDTRLTTAETDIDNLETSRLKTYTSDSTAWDSTPTASSIKPVTSGGIKTELDSKLPTYASDSTVWDTIPTASSTNPVTSGGILTDINSKVSHENLLDNPWFTVNQRGFTSVSNLNGASKYTVDRWFSYMRSGSVGAVTLNDGEMTISNNSASELLVNIGQNVENDLSGKLLTISVLLHDGTIARGSFIMPSEGGADVTAINEEDFNVYFQHKSGQKCSLGISVPMGSSITIKAVKLELGSVSTLANDTAPNYQQELSKCQRYFQRINLKENYTQIGFFRSGNTTSANGTLYFLTPMRIKPSVQANNISSLSLYMGADIFNVSAISSSSKAVYSGDNAIAIELVATTSGMTNGAVGILSGNHSSGSVNPSIDFSADL